MKNDIETIYVQLLHEDVTTARPAPAERVGKQTYTILLPEDYDPEDEEWQFLPGDTVRCERTHWNEKGAINLAIEKII
ncbi:MAG: hypothetical protein ABW189_06645 [Rickettsiales bacterium]